MNRDKFSTPLNKRPLRTGLGAGGIPTTARKRDTLAAELERDPQTSTAKRQQRTTALTSHMAHAALERQLAAAQAARAELDAQLRAKGADCERLERERAWLAEREREARDEGEKERAERAEEKRVTDAELRTLRSDLRALREQHADLTDAHDTLSRTTTAQSSAYRAQLTTLSHDVQSLRAELASSQNLAAQYQTRVEELEEDLDGLQGAADRSMALESEAETWGVLRDELSKQAEYLRSLENAHSRLQAETATLRERAEGAEVLREKVRELERRAAGVEALREKVVSLEAELDAARKEREEWAEKAANLSLPEAPSQVPVSTTQALSSLRLDHARLLEEHGVTSALLARRDKELAEATAERERMADEADMLRADVRAAREQIARREQRIALAEREVDFLQALLNSFQAEESAHPSGTDAVSVLDEAQVQRIAELEALLETYKQENQRLQTEADALSAEAAHASGAAKHELKAEVEDAHRAREEAETALKEADRASEELLAKIDELEQTLFELRGEIGGGRHVPPGVRVLSLQDNPAQQWADTRQAALDRLREENEALLARLRALEEGGARAMNVTADDSAIGDEEGALVPRASWEALKKENEEAQEALKQREKRLLRLQQIYKDKSQEFKNAIETMLGLKFTFYPNGQVRITSLFDLTASFVFQPDKDKKSGGGGGRMQLVAQGEAAPQDVDQWMRNWLAEEQCIPGFLATVTLECYDMWKRNGGEGGQL